MIAISAGLIASVLASTCLPGVLALNNGKSLQPQLGWNTWNYHGCNITENIVLEAGQQLIDTGLVDKGYKIVWIDDCWQADQRNKTTGQIYANPKKFPSGLKGVVDKLHGMGLQAGIYSDAGVYTCGGHVGSLGHEETDAKTFADAGFDALKYDNCYNQGQSGNPLISFDRYNKMSQAINSTGRPMVMSLCNWGEDGPWSWAQETWNSWRISGDIFDTFDREDDRCPCKSMIDCKLSGFHCSVKKIINFSAPLGQKARSGGWNDLDMLQVGNGGMTRDEEITHFSMWAMVKSPLIMGNDMATISNQTIAIVGNNDVMAVNQDSAHNAASRLSISDEDHQFWLASLSNNSYALAIVNFGPTNFSAAPTFADLFVDTPKDAVNSYAIYDLWAGVDFASPNSSKPAEQIQGSPMKTAFATNITVPSHGTRVFKMVPS